LWPLSTAPTSGASIFSVATRIKFQAYQQQYGGSINEQLLRQLGVDQQILQQMVDEQAALTEADRQGIRISDEELAQQIFSIPALQENGRFIGEQRYEQLLASQYPPITKGDFEQSLRRSMMVDKLRSAVTDWVSVSDSDLEREYRNRNEKVKLQVVALTADKFRDKVTVNDADIASYYDAHKTEYRKGESRKIRYLLVDRDQLRSRITVTPQEIESYYNSNIQQFQAPEQVRASHILLKTDGKDEADRQKAGRGHPEAGESPRCGLRCTREEILGRRRIEGQRRRPRLLPERPYGP
jgi:peptidyl-prolyl cis-trans isomerase D